MAEDKLLTEIDRKLKEIKGLDRASLSPEEEKNVKFDENKIYRILGDKLVNGSELSQLQKDFLTKKAQAILNEPVEEADKGKFEVVARNSTAKAILSKLNPVEMLSESDVVKAKGLSAALVEAGSLRDRVILKDAIDKSRPEQQLVANGFLSSGKTAEQIRSSDIYESKEVKDALITLGQSQLSDDLKPYNYVPQVQQKAGIENSK